jgi:hypothetical protein
MNSIALITIVLSVLSPLLEGVALYSAILFFRTDRRLHTWVLVIGAAGQLLIRPFFWMRRTGVIGPGFGKLEDLHFHFAVQSGVSLIFAAMFAYGLVSVALIHYRKSQTPALES